MRTKICFLYASRRPSGSFFQKNPDIRPGQPLADRRAPIGTATIYRQLERFVQEGCVRKYLLGPGECACYAYMENQTCETHFHCRCDVCGRLIHLDCDELREIQAHLLEHHGFAWDSGRTVFYGVCDQCRKA